MESKKIKIALVIAFGVFLNLSVALVLSAFIYCNVTGLADSGVTCAAGGAIILNSIDPLFLWIIVWAAALLVILTAAVILIFYFRAKRKKRKGLAAEAQSDGPAGENAAAQSDGVQASVYEEEFSAYLAEHDGQSADGDALMQLAVESADVIGATGDKPPAGDALLEKHIRDVNEKSDEYNDAQAKLAELTKKCTKLKQKAAQLQKHIFKSNDQEYVNRCSVSLNKVYKFISKYEERIAEYKQIKSDLRDGLTKLRRSAGSYISLCKIPLETVVEVEDVILLDIALSKRLAGNSGDYAVSESGVSGEIKEKRDAADELEAELDGLRQSLDDAGDDDRKLDALIKILETEEKLDTVCDELGGLMCRFIEEIPQASVEEITASVKAEIVSGSGIVASDKKKLDEKKSN